MKLIPCLLASLPLLLPVPGLADPVNINTADAATLARELKGVGEARARAIVEHRSQHGPFRSADELVLVRGIGQKVVDQNRANYGDVAIAGDVLEFLAHRITTNVRVLEGALTRLFALASLLGREVTLDLAQDCLADILRSSERKVTVEEIQRKVAEHYNIRLSDMIGPKRLRTIARPRQIAMYLAKHMTTRSLPEIGRRFGGRDHTTILHGVRKVEELRATDSQLSEDLVLLRRLLES